MKLTQTRRLHLFFKIKKGWQSTTIKLVGSRNHLSEVKTIQLGQKITNGQFEEAFLFNLYLFYNLHRARLCNWIIHWFHSFKGQLCWEFLLVIIGSNSDETKQNLKYMFCFEEWLNTVGRRLWNMLMFLCWEYCLIKSSRFRMHVLKWLFS